MHLLSFKLSHVSKLVDSFKLKSQIISPFVFCVLLFVFFNVTLNNKHSRSLHCTKIEVVAL